MKPIEHIDQYMAGELSADDKATFEAAMQQDADLHELVDNYDKIKEISTVALEEQLLQEVKKAANSAPSQQKSKSNLTKYLSIAASILILVFAVFYLSKPSEEYILGTYHEKPFDPDNVRSSDLPNMSNFQLAKYNYGLNEFEISRDLFEEELVKNADAAEVKDIQFWLAHVYLEIGRYDEALIMYSSSGRPADPCFNALCNYFISSGSEKDLKKVCSAT